MPRGVWPVEHFTGHAADFHARQPDARRAAWFFRVGEPSLVLGSTQHTAVDEEAARCHGVVVTRRRSGGAAVLLMPEEFVWLDVVVPAGDAQWVDDVGVSMHWIGDLWAAALGPWIDGLHVHQGSMLRRELSEVVCFAGLGPGEVTDAAGRKVVGVSQRRTRHWLRLQTMCHLRWRADLYAQLLGIDDIVARLDVAEVPAGASDIVAALTHRLAEY
jgi:lipoate---protein ligase